MHTVRTFEPGLWTVGSFNPDGAWVPISDHNDEQEAFRQVHYLNGGNPCTIHLEDPLLSKLKEALHHGR